MKTVDGITAAKSHSKPAQEPVVFNDQPEVVAVHRSLNNMKKRQPLGKKKPLRRLRIVLSFLCIPLILSLSFFGSIGLIVFGILLVVLLIKKTDARSLFALTLITLVFIVPLQLVHQRIAAGNMANLTYLCLGSSTIALGLQSGRSSVTRFNKR